MHSNLTLRPLSQPPAHCPHHQSLLMDTVNQDMEEMTLQGSQPGQFNSSMTL